MMHLLPSPPIVSFPANPSLLLVSPPSCPPRRVSSAVVSAASRDVDSFTSKSGYLFSLSSDEADSLSEYNFARIDGMYKKKPLILLRRLAQIGTTFGFWFGLRLADEALDRSEQMFKVRAAELRKLLVELGPAYVKIAQAVSSRPDLIPPSYLDELSLLQDQITPFSTEVAFSMIEDELGLPIDEIFSEISPEPVAAASLGQVYKARLRRTGDVVAVKVQRPGVRAAIALDTLILRHIAGLIKKAGRFNSDLQAVVDEWATSLFKEMDYLKEAQNGILFRKLYGSIKDVLVPKMYTEYSTSKVLVMEWVEGQKLAEVNDLYLVEVGVYCSFNQLLEYGFYHADPHPGNFLRTYDGQLAYLDFGMMGDFRPELRDGFMEACLHLVNRDFKALAKDFVTLGLLPPTAEKGAVTKALTDVFQGAISRGVRNISFGDLLGDLGITMYKFKFRIPPYFSLVIRSLAVLEGIAIGISPNYKVLGSTYPWIARKILTDSSPQLKSSLQNLLYEDGVFRIDRLESLITESLRTETALVQKPVEGGTDSKIVIKQIFAFTLTEQGSFVREILLQELAKGLDALGLATLDSFTSMPFSGSRPSTSLTEEDITNLRTFYRLISLFSGMQKEESVSTQVNTVTKYGETNTPLAEASLVMYQLPSAQEMLPILSILPELPQESQQRLLQLPGDLVGRLVSRAFARTIRRMFL
uniref:Putative aarF domain-containing protein kinase, chloroplastic n=1 Tax=Noccaea caerulescens TaxID=107243 RepID=A0A1J3H1J1_NOCCA